jgi:DNA-binding transcriptional MerR regulator
MSERSHLSIGEVLSLLREEFPDVTISKIRFLESQGLVDPERTPSGYRKFYDHDVDRLRWILRQQREHFLPLKVIRGRLTDPGEEVDEVGLAEGDEDEAEADAGETGEPATPAPSPVAEPVRAVDDVSERDPTQVPAAVTASTAASDENGPTGLPVATPLAESQPDLLPAGVAAASAAAASRRPAETRPPPRPGHVTPSLFTEARPDPTDSAAPGPSADPGGPAASTPTPAASTPKPAASTPKPAASTPKPAGTPRRGRQAAEESESYSADELATAAGATAELVAELKQFGLVSPHAVVAGTPYFDECALAVTRAAAQFAGYGVEVRHLRAWRNAADREAGLFEQIVLPLLRQRNPQARQQAAETLSDLARLGADLRSALLDQAIRDIR